MSKIFYKDWNPAKKSMMLVGLCNDVITELMAEGYTLTLRQLYYQLVARGWIPNEQRQYDRLSEVLDNARKAGMIDWDAIEDRTRFLRGWNKVEDPAEAVAEAIEDYHIDLWKGSDYKVEVWIEKDALVGVLGNRKNRVCDRFGVDYFSCRGYVSATAMHNAAKRAKWYNKYKDKQTVILHLGDHDPSGIDMTRDMQSRLNLFQAGHCATVERIALTMEQIEEIKPPPNPTKMSDSRAPDYVSMYGHDSWELDALSPSYIEELVEKHIRNYMDEDLFDERMKQEDDDKEYLEKISENWDAVQDFLDNL